MTHQHTQAMKNRFTSVFLHIYHFQCCFKEGLSVLLSKKKRSFWETAGRITISPLCSRRAVNMEALCVLRDFSPFLSDREPTFVLW